jgi:hypothetical protein
VEKPVILYCTILPLCCAESNTEREKEREREGEGEIESKSESGCVCVCVRERERERERECKSLTYDTKYFTCPAGESTMTAPNLKVR